MDGAAGLFESPVFVVSTETASEGEMGALIGWEFLRRR
jgi:hypothetical protein